MFCKTNGDKRSQELHLSTCIQLRALKHPSSKVINFRHLLSCDTMEKVGSLKARSHDPFLRIRFLVPKTGSRRSDGPI